MPHTGNQASETLARSLDAVSTKRLIRFVCHAVNDPKRLTDGCTSTRLESAMAAPLSCEIRRIADRTGARCHGYTLQPITPNRLLNDLHCNTGYKSISW